MTWWKPIDRILTPRRLNYALIAGGVLWFAWMISILFGPGDMDLAGQVVGTDYLQFYSAGVTLRQGQSANLYNQPFQIQMEQSIAGPDLTSYHAFITPPFLAWLYVPFSFLPYTLSFLAWSLIGFFFLWVSIKLIAPDQSNKSILWALTWFPIFAAISFGQNSLLSLFLFSLTYWLWKKDKYLLAGLVSSLLLYKPQLVLGLGLLWLLEWRSSWKSLLGLAAGGATLAGLSFWLLPEASREYINLAMNILPGLMYQDQFPLLHLHSLRGFFTLLFPGIHWLSEGLSLLLSIAGVVVYIIFWQKNRGHKNLIFAGAICLTIWITPHAMVYDWSILVIPAILFWQAYPHLKPLLKTMYALLWVAMFLSTPLTLAQLRFLPIAIQISIPILALTLLVFYKSVISLSSQDLDDC